MGFGSGKDKLKDLDVDGGTISVDAANDKVGIGTTSPKTKLTVEGTVTIKEQANAESDTAAYGQLWVKTATPNELYFTTDAGDDVRITNGTSLAAAASSAAVAADDITTGDAAINLQTSSGNVLIDSQAGTTTVDGHTGVTIQSSNSGEVDITSAAAVDINATTGITVDGTTVSIDGTDDSNLTVTASGKDLDIAVAGGGTQELRLASAGTGASALHLNASAGGIDIDSADMIDIDAADEITIDTTSADGHIAITSAHTAGQSILISANAAAGSILDIDAGIVDIDVQDTINIDAADEIEIATTSADGHITLTSAHTSGVAFHIDANADAASEVQIDAGVLDIDVTAGITIDGTTLSIDGTDDSNITVTASAKDLDIAVAGGGTQELRLASAGTGASALHLNASAGSVDIDSADAITVDAADEIVVTTTSADGHISLVSAHTAGVAVHIDADAAAGSIVDIDAGILDIDVTGDASLDSSAGSITVGAALADGQTLKLGKNGAAEMIFTPHGTAGNEKISLINTAGTSVTEGSAAVSIQSLAGGVELRSTANLANAINITNDGGTTGTITLFNDQGTSVTEGAASIQLLTDDGGIGIKSTANLASAILITADGGTSETIKVHADQGSGVDSIELTSDAGGIELNTAKGIHLNDLGEHAGTPASGYGVIYVNGDVPYFKTDGGTATSMIAGGGGATAADDIGTGDAAVNIVTTSGNITLDAQANDADIIFKVDDNGSAVTALTLDGSDEGNAIFVNDLKLQSDSAAIHFGANDDIVLTHEADRGLILTQATETTAEPVFTIKNTGDLASGGGIEFLLDNGAGEGDDDILGFVSFKGDDSGNGATQFAKLEVLSSDVTDGDEAGKFAFSVMAGGTAGTAAMVELLGIGGEDTANSTHCEVTINEGQIDCDFRVESNHYTHLLFCNANDNAIGIMNNAPVGSLDVVSDYQSVTFENKIGTTNIGGGKKIIYSPGANDTLTKGQLYFLHTDGTWDQTNANAVATGASQLLGVPAVGGASQTYPMILEGYIRIPSTEILNVPGSGAVDGLPVYVSTTAGHFDFTAPSGASDFVRIVGYAIDDHSGDVLIYFNPDKTWVEI